MKLTGKIIGDAFGLRRRLSFWSFAFAALLAAVFVNSRRVLRGQEMPAATSATFYRDVVPILQQHCEVCHRQGGVAPMAFQTYVETRPYAAAIAQAAEGRTMPPWFAQKDVGKFANDPSLTDGEIATLLSWVKGKTPAGNPADAPAPRNWVGGWIMPAPDMELKMPAAVEIPAIGDIEYTYEIVPTHFTEGRWAQAS